MFIGQKIPDGQFKSLRNNNNNNNNDENVLNTPSTQQGHESEQRFLAHRQHFLRTTSCEVSGRVPTMAGGWSKGSQHRGIWVLAQTLAPNKSCFFSSNCACHVTERPDFLNKTSGASTEAKAIEGRSF